MAKQTPSINLIKKNETPIVDRVINWAVNIGRGLIVLTEVVALTAFIYRFTLDRQLIDLHTEIAARTIQTNFFAKNETVYRNIQDKLAQAQTLTAQQKQSLAVFTTMMQMDTGTVQISNFSLFKKTLRIEAIIFSPSALTQLVDSLKSYQSIASVSVDRIASKPQSGQITVNITATLK